MPNSPNQALRWKKTGKPVTFVLPNSEVQPEIICEASDTQPGIIIVSRVYEQLIQRLFGSPQIMVLERDSARTIDGKVHIQYEAWKAPHLPPVNRHTKYVFRTDTHQSTPLYVCAPVQITVETGLSASAGVDLNPSLKGAVSRSTAFNMQISAPIDPTIHFEVVTKKGEYDDKELGDIIYRYAEDLSRQGKLKSSEINDYIYKTYERYLSHDSGIVRVGEIEPIIIGEGETASVPLEFIPVRTGYTLVVISAVDDQGERVFSDFIGLQCDAEAGTVTQEF